MLIVAGVFLFSRIITLENIPQNLTKISLSFSKDNPYLFLIALNILLFIMGCFIEAVAALIIAVPVVLPLAIAMGIDLIPLGVIIVFNRLGFNSPQLCCDQ